MTPASNKALLSACSAALLLALGGCGDDSRLDRSDLGLRGNGPGNEPDSTERYMSKEAPVSPDQVRPERGGERERRGRAEREG